MWAWHIPWNKVKGNFIMKKNRNRQKKCPTFFIFGGDRREGDWKLKRERRRGGGGVDGRSWRGVAS